MKKLLLTLGIVGLMSSSAFAGGFIQGKVVKVSIWPGDTAYFVSDSSQGDCEIKVAPRVENTADERKAIYAAMLTALSANKVIRMWTVEDPSGACGVSASSITFDGFEVAN